VWPPAPNVELDAEDPEEMRMWWFSRWVTLPFGVLGGIVVFALMLLTVIDVIQRSLSGQGVPGVVEYSEVLLVIAVFCAIAAAQVRGFHVSTTGLVDALPRTAHRSVVLIGALLGTPVIAIMAVVAVSATWTSFADGEYRIGIAQVLVWPARAAVAVGLILYLVEYIHGAIARFGNSEIEEEEHRDLVEQGALL
jgi:TRAP-type C4-dicarboxylate transport system permease small subunit